MTREDALNKGMTAKGKRQVGLENAVRYWPTPCATDAKPITGGNLFRTKSGTIRHRRPDGSSSNRGLSASVMWPTPTQADSERSSSTYARGNQTLTGAVKMFPTVTAADSRNSRNSTANRSPNSRHHSGTTLSDHVHKWPTPHGFSKDGRSNGPSGNELGRAVNQNGTNGGSLNPPWVEWLMGWPIEWTDLRPLATDKFRTRWLSLGLRYVEKLRERI
jgi:hypothetical protein